MLATHPSTAQHIAFKLAQRFVADEPPAALVDRAAKMFLDTKGDLREVTRVDHHVAGVLRADDVSREGEDAARVRRLGRARDQRAHRATRSRWSQALRNLGMPLYGAQPPTGYSMTADAWVNTGALLNRMNFAVQLLNGGAHRSRRGPGPDGGQPRRPAAARRTGSAAAGAASGRAAAARPGRGRAGAAAQLARGPMQVDVRALAPDTSEASRDQRDRHRCSPARRPTRTRQTLARATTPQQLRGADARIAGIPEAIDGSSVGEPSRQEITP